MIFKKMGTRIIFTIALTVLLLNNFLYSQADKNNKTLNRQGPVVNNGLNLIKGDEQVQNTQDYKVISSGSTYIEIEYYPQFNPQEKIVYNGETFSIITFENGTEKGPKYAGQPDVRSRMFPVIFPSDANYSVTVVEADSRDAGNINLAPIANFKLRDPSKRDLDNVEIIYDKDTRYYSKNSYFPEQIASIDKPGSVRELLLGSLIIIPYQYNPVTKSLRQFTRIRVRINFGANPVMLNRARSYNELQLLKGIAINSDIAINWMNPKLAFPKDNRVANSVMKFGDWYRIEIKDNGSGNSDGVYKITKGFLESAGINLSGVDPRTIKMYGNGGDMLAENFNDPRPGDLNQIAIYIEGENDGSFDANDYILFYGKSANNWKLNVSTGTYTHVTDIYSVSNFYWVQLGTSGNGNRMPQIPSENVPNPYVPTSFKEKLFYEPEINNLISEGNVWLSERKSNGQTFEWNNTLTGLEANTDILYKIKPASRVFCGYDNRFEVKEKNSNMSAIPFTMGCVTSGYSDWIWTSQFSFTMNSSQKTNGEQSSFDATFLTNSPDGEGYLDWMEIQYNRRLNSASNDFIRIISNDQNTVEYNVSSFSNSSIRIFDATSHNDVKLIQPLNPGGNSVRFQRTQNVIESKYFVVGQNGYKTPTGISQRISNQNIRGDNTDGADFIIITHKDILPAAERLKNKREAGGPNNPSYLKTKIFDTESIYNEFSGGILDPVAIRDFLKYAYDTWAIRPSYVCFFGDGDFDYKNILVQDKNWVPAFEYSDPNINQVNGYTSDDFFCMVSGEDSKPDIAHGRIPAQGLDQASTYLDKVDCYEDPSNNDYWKNKSVFVADDGRTSYGNDGSQHTDQCEQLAELYFPQSVDKIKLYLVTYPAVITSQGRRKPGVNADIIKYWNEGCISLNWTGHGSPELWAHEVVLEKDVVISQIHNTCKYPFVSIASCDFSKFDNPLSVSGGELFMITPRKGAIGTLAATRPVYGQQNSVFNNTFWNYLLNSRDTLLLQKRFGQAVFQTKQQWNSVNDLKFVLLCDPTLRVQIPRFRSRIDSISGLSNDTMRALSRVKIFGSVMNPDSSLWSTYNGKIFLKIFDVTKQIVMHDEDNFEFRFKLPGGIIYSGTQNITNGKWAVEFIVPKDISYLNEHGKLINYFYNGQADGSSLYTNFIVGGIDPTAIMDTTGPDIKAYIDTKNFRSGDVVNQNFKFMADLFDESGINTTGTIGHKIEGVLDNDENNKYDFTSFYNSDTTYKSGHLEYDFASITEGKHSLKLKAWDTYNNSSEVTIEFTVTSSGSLQVSNVYNFPNPFKDRTAFTFQHNYPGSVNVTIKIYTVAGRLIKEIKSLDITDKFVMIDWAGTDEDGEKLGNGIYIYKLTVEPKDGTAVTSTGKLAVLK